MHRLIKVLQNQLAITIFSKISQKKHHNPLNPEPQNMNQNVGTEVSGQMNQNLPPQNSMPL